MNNISISRNADGTLVARWCGKSVRDGNTVRKEDQKYLGKVIDLDRMIFFKKNEGYYVFNPEDQSFRSLSANDVPIAPPKDKREREPNVIVTFGGCYFLNALIHGIKYDEVLDSLNVLNKDTLYALLSYYVLSPCADMHAYGWYRDAYARLLYPKANLASQRISDFYVSVGHGNNRQTFFEKHIEYLKGVTKDEFCIIVDSTGCQNAVSKMWKTKVSRHENVVNVEFRVVLVVHRSTGLPVYYETISGNIVDISTVDRITDMMHAHGLEVTLVSGDAGYACPSSMERLILCGCDILMRLNPTYDTYKDILEEHRDELSPERTDQAVLYRNRVVQVVKAKAILAEDPETGEAIDGFVYLCRDMQAYHTKSSHFMRSKTSKTMTAAEISETCWKFGVFAIVDTRDLSPEDVLPQYYMRQNVEQFFDSAKSFGKMMPVRNHNEETIEGHMFLSFMTTFLWTVIENRMNIMDSPYVMIPSKLTDIRTEEEVVVIQQDGETEAIDAQDVCEMVYESSPGALVMALNQYAADVFEDQKNGEDEVIPAVIHKEAREYFHAFGIAVPRKILIKDKDLLIPLLREGDKNTCSKRKAFALRPILTEEEIIRKREEAEKLRLLNKAEKIGVDLSNTELGSLKKKPGRPKGSKKKNTLEAEEARETKQQTNEVSAPSETEDRTEPIIQNRGRGRPKGSKNKKTLEREAEERALGITHEKRSRGRPKGAKNKKTLEREAKEARKQKREERRRQKEEEKNRME